MKGYIRITLLDENGRHAVSTPKVIRENFEFVAALAVVHYIAMRAARNGKVKRAIVELVNLREERGYFSSLVRKYSPVPIEIRNVREEVETEAAQS